MRDDELKVMKKSFKTLQDRSEDIINSEYTKSLEERVKKIRKNAIDNNEELLEKARSSFKRNGIELYEAKDGDEANNIILNLIKEYNPKTNIISKSKSNTLGEISFRDFIEDNGYEIIETDLGDRLLQLKNGDNKPSHCTAPAAHLDVNQITDIVNDALGTDLNPVHNDIMVTVREDVLDKLNQSEIGISGANSIAARDGAMVIVHNEGNVSKVASKKLHIVVAGIDKLVDYLEDCMPIVRLESIYGTGSYITSYINIIAGPSKTADIEKKLLKGMYGSKRLVVILLDNGRSTAIKESLLCIGCGNCVVNCPVYNVVGNEFGYNYYLGGRGIALAKSLSKTNDKDNNLDEKLFMCTLCGLCTFNCPVSSPTFEMIENLRNVSTKEGFTIKAHKQIKNNIGENGSPYN